MSQQYLSAGLGGKFPPNQEMSVVYHPQPVSPSEIVDINPPNKHAFELQHLPKPERQECTGTGNPKKLHGDTQVPLEVFRKGQLHGQEMGGTRPENLPANIHSHSTMRTPQSNALLPTKIKDISRNSRLNEHQPQTLHRLITDASTLQCEKSLNPGTGYRVTDSPDRPMMQPSIESFGLEERQENEEIDIALGVGRKEPLKKTDHKNVMDSSVEALEKIKRKKGKDNSCSPRPIPPRNQTLVTQPLQDQEAELLACLLASQYDGRYETKQKEVNEDCHKHLNLTGHTCKVSDQEFLKLTEQLPERNQDGLWIVHHDLHPVEGAYQEGHHFKAEIFTKGGFGIVSLCRDMVSMKEFIQKSVPKEKWRKAENIALITLKSHPNICELLGMKQERGSDGITVSLFLEYAGMSLSKFMRMTQQDKLTHQEIWDISEQMFCGQVHLHRHGILHLDLKPDNICIQGKRGNLSPKIIDFGSAKLSQEPLYFCGMTPEYLAPEVCTCFIAEQHGISLAEHFITGKADVAAGALIILYMIEGYDVLIKLINNGQTSYAGKTTAEVKSLRMQLVLTHARNPNLASHFISDGIDINLKELLKGCLVGHPEGRFSSQQALQFMEERKNRTMSPQPIPNITAVLKKLEASVGSQFVVTPSNEYFQFLRYPNQHGRGGLQTFQQTTQAGVRMFGLSSEQDSHGIFKVSNRNKLRDKTEPYPTRRHSSCSASEDLYTNGTILHQNATGVIPTTVNPETYPAASDSHGGNLPNLDILE